MVKQHVIFFYPKLISLISKNDINLNHNLFKIRIFNNINILYIIFIDNFPKFNLYLKNFDYLDKF